MTKQLLIVAHAPSANTRVLRDAVVRGAGHEDIDGVAVTCLSPFDTEPEHVMSAQAIILGTTENLGYMSGALKDFFDRNYYPCLEQTQGLPYALYIRAGHDGTGTRRGVETIVTGPQMARGAGAADLSRRLPRRICDPMRGAGHLDGRRPGSGGVLSPRHAEPGYRALWRLSLRPDF